MDKISHWSRFGDIICFQNLQLKMFYFLVLFGTVLVLLISYITLPMTSILMLRNNMRQFFLSEDTVYSSMRSKCISVGGENP